MSARTRLTAAELEAKWMDPDARGLANNLAEGVRIVTMRDGTAYETPLDEIHAHLRDQEAADRAEYDRYDAEAEAGVRRCRVCGCTDDNACLPPCWWVEPDLCSACHPGQPTESGAGS